MKTGCQNPAHGLCFAHANLTPVNSPAPPPPAAPWLLRIPEIFAAVVPEIIGRLGSSGCTQLGHEYYLIRAGAPAALRQAAVGRLVRWNLPVHHSWPCCPRSMPGFVEKAAQSLARKFAAQQPQSLLIGLLDATPWLMGAPNPKQITSLSHENNFVKKTSCNL